MGEDQLAGMDEEGLRRVLGELLGANAGIQANFDAIREQFPIQPSAVSDAIPTVEELEEGGLVERDPETGELEPGEAFESLGIPTFRFIYKTGYSSWNKGQHYIRFNREGLKLEESTKMKMAGLDENGHVLSEILSYFSGVGTGTHRGMIFLFGDNGGFATVEITAASVEVFSGGPPNGGRIFSVSVGNMDEEEGSLFRDGEGVSVFAVGNAKGDAGEKGATGAPGLEWKGAWAAGTEYAVNQAVTSKGSSYRAIKAGKGHEPPNAEFWELLAEKGEAGAAGTAGRDAGLKYTWLTNTEATDPGSGKIKTIAAKTAVRISETDGDGNAIAALIKTWDDSTSETRGYLTVRQVGSPKRFITWEITAANVDEGAFDKLTGRVVAEGEALENEKEVRVEFSRTGDKGEAGALVYRGSENSEVGKASLTTLRKNKLKWAEVTQIGFSIESVNWNGSAASNLLHFVPSAGMTIMISELNSRVNKVLLRVKKLIEVTGNAYVFEVETLLNNGSAEFGKSEESFLEVLFYSPKDHGLRTSFPAAEETRYLDTCTIIADAANGVFWRFVYDGEGEFKWKCIGGPPLIAEVQTFEKTASKAFTDLTTKGPKLTLPLAGDYDIEVLATCSLPSYEEAVMAYAIGATAASDEDAASFAHDNIAAAVASTNGARRRKAGLANGAEVLAKYHVVVGAEANIGRRRLIITPVRCK